MDEPVSPVIPLTTTSLARGTRFHFAHEEVTTAPPAALWTLWTELDRWPAWDTELTRAELAPPRRFEAGARGVLASRGAPPSRFTVLACEQGRGYTFATALPLGRLVISRRLEPTPAGGTRFTHEVRFEGPGGWLLAWVLGARFRRALPQVMARLRTLAESSSLEAHREAERDAAV